MFTLPGRLFDEDNYQIFQDELKISQRGTYEIITIMNQNHIMMELNRK